MFSFGRSSTTRVCHRKLVVSSKTEAMTFITALHVPGKFRLNTTFIPMSLLLMLTLLRSIASKLVSFSYP